MKRPHFALPEIYDDSLSYYDVLRKLIKSMHAIVDNLNKIPEQIANEAKAREQADGTLQTNIDNEAIARQEADNEEVTARQQADTVLDGKISELKSDLASEQTSREQADTSLQHEISGKLPKSPLNWEPWTAEEQATARERMGIPGDYELIETISLTEEVSEIIRDTDTLGNQYSMKNLLLYVSANSTTLKMSIRISINGAYIVDTEKIGDNAYTYNYVCRFDINNGIISTFLIGYRGSIQNRFPVNSSIKGMTTFLDTIKSVRLQITNPIEGATIKIYGVRA